MASDAKTGQDQPPEPPVRDCDATLAAEAETGSGGRAGGSSAETGQTISHYRILRRLGGHPQELCCRRTLYAQRTSEILAFMELIPSSL